MGSAGDTVQALLAAVDGTMTRSWREEDAAWRAYQQEVRAQDVQWMSAERSCMTANAELRSRRREWREEDMQQRNLENARCLWLRFVEKNRRDVEEKSELLKAVSSLSALFAGFAIVTLTQFQPPEGNYSKGLYGVYGVLTAVVEGLMTISMVKCTLILGGLVKVGKTYVSEDAEEQFMFRCLAFCRNYTPGDLPPNPTRTLEAFWDTRCEASWQRAFHCFSFGVSLFLLSMIMIGWIKYSGSSQLTSILFISLCAIAILLWFLVQCAWIEFFRRRRVTAQSFVRPFSEDPGLPFAWHLTNSFEQGE